MMMSSKPRTNNDTHSLFLSPLLLLFLFTVLASTTALASAIRFPPRPSPPFSSSSSASAGQTPDAKLANSLAGTRYVEKPPRDPPNTVYLAIEVATTNRPSPRATITLMEKVFLVDYEPIKGESEDKISSPGSLDSFEGSGFDADVNIGDDGEEEKSQSRRYESGPIIRIGKISFKRITAIFETQILLNPPEGTTCMLDEVEPQKRKVSGPFRTVDRMREQSDVMTNIIPFKYKPLMKLATGITCIQRQVD